MPRGMEHASSEERLEVGGTGLTQTDTEEAKRPPRSSQQLHERGLTKMIVPDSVIVPDNITGSNSQKL